MSCLMTALKTQIERMIKSDCCVNIEVNRRVRLAACLCGLCGLCDHPLLLVLQEVDRLEDFRGQLEPLG